MAYLVADRAGLGPLTIPVAPGSGPVTCPCTNHRSRCIFGRPHSWVQWYSKGRLVRTVDTYACMPCGAVCTAEEG